MIFLLLSQTLYHFDIILVQPWSLCTLPHICHAIVDVPTLTSSAQSTSSTTIIRGSLSVSNSPLGFWRSLSQSLARHHF